MAVPRLPGNCLRLHWMQPPRSFNVQERSGNFIIPRSAISRLFSASPPDAPRRAATIWATIRCLPWLTSGGNVDGSRPNELVPQSQTETDGERHGQITLQRPARLPPSPTIARDQIPNDHERSASD